MKNEIIIEVCAGSYEDCVAAKRGGADRVELNSALELGGLTPELSALIRAKDTINIPVMCMCRPRGAGFNYSISEIEGMMLEAKLLLEHGADGIVFGILCSDGKVDFENTKKMVELIHAYDKTAVFHRAFDVTPDPVEAIESLIECGVDRVLTSGQEASADKAIRLLAKLQEQYGDKIEILPGCGITADNAYEIVSRTRVKQIHSSCKKYEPDPTTTRGNVSFSCHDSSICNCYQSVDEQEVYRLVNQCIP